MEGDAFGMELSGMVAIVSDPNATPVDNNVLSHDLNYC
jgi:hypothetical protein